MEKMSQKGMETTTFSSLFGETVNDTAAPATIPPFPPFPVLTQEQKREQRRFARIAKKSRKQDDQVQKKIDEIRCINSGKVKVIDRKTAEIHQSALKESSTVEHRPAQKLQSKPLVVELADSIRTPRQEKQAVRSGAIPDTPIQRNKGKKREIPKKKLSRLKKKILREQLDAKPEQEPTVQEEIVAAFETVTISEHPPPAIAHSRNFRP
jgi:hypothetical protein